MLVELVVAGAVTTVAVVKHLRKPKLTPEKREIYFNALKHLKEPEKLEKLADAFQKDGLVKEAELLRKRANLRRLPQEEKEKRSAIFKKAMASKNRDAVLQVAELFEHQGATGAAYNLRRYAAQLLEEQKS